MSIPTYTVRFEGGPLDTASGEVRHLAPIGIDGGPFAGRGVYRYDGAPIDGYVDVIFEWEPVEPGRALIESHRPQLPAREGLEDIAHRDSCGARTSSLSSLSGRPAEPLADASGGGPSASTEQRNFHDPRGASG